MEGAAYQPLTQAGHLHATFSGYYPGPQTFNTNVSPPPYFGHPAPAPQAQQHSSSNVVVVQSQPSVITTTFRPIRDHYLTLGIVLTILCILFGTWHALFCTIPAIIFSIMARDADARGDTEAALTNGRIAMGLNVGGLVFCMLFIVGIIIAVIVVTSATTDSVCYGNDIYGYTYSYYCSK